MNSNSNYINLQRDSEFSGGNVNKVYDWLHNLPIEEQEKLSELSYGEVIKEYQKTQPIQEEANFEKFSKLVSDKVSPVHEKMKDIKQEHVWDEAHIEFSKYCENFDKYNNRTYQDFFEWAKKNNYTLTKK